MNILRSTLLPLALAASAFGAAAKESPQAKRLAAEYSVTCTSGGEPMTYCDWDASRGRPKVLHQLSRRPCIRNATWGYTNRGVWVKSGCAAEFVPSR